MQTEITAALVGIISALITAFITKSNADKRNSIQNITQERKKWRDDLRGATIALRRYFENKDRFCKKGTLTDGKENCGIIFHSAAEAKAFFELRLNTNDLEDRKLMAILDRLVTYDCASRKPLFQKWEPKENDEKHFRTKDLGLEDLLAYFEEGMSLNLKHDWERAKKEVKGHGLLTCFLTILGILFMLNFCLDDILAECYNLKDYLNFPLLCISVCLGILLVGQLEKYLANFNWENEHKLKKILCDFSRYTPRTKLKRL